MADKQLAIALVGTDEASGVVGQSARKMAADLEALQKRTFDVGHDARARETREMSNHYDTLAAQYKAQHDRLIAYQQVAQQKLGTLRVQRAGLRATPEIVAQEREVHQVGALIARNEDVQAEAARAKQAEQDEMNRRYQVAAAEKRAADLAAIERRLFDSSHSARERELRDVQEWKARELAVYKNDAEMRAKIEEAAGQQTSEIQKRYSAGTIQRFLVSARALKTALLGAEVYVAYEVAKGIAGAIEAGPAETAAHASGQAAEMMKGRLASRAAIQGTYTWIPILGGIAKGVHDSIADTKRETALAEHGAQTQSEIQELSRSVQRAALTSERSRANFLGYTPAEMARLDYEQGRQERAGRLREALEVQGQASSDYGRSRELHLSKDEQQAFLVKEQQAKRYVDQLRQVNAAEDEYAGATAKRAAQMEKANFWRGIERESLGAQFTGGPGYEQRQAVELRLQGLSQQEELAAPKFAGLDERLKQSGDRETWLKNYQARMIREHNPGITRYDAEKAWKREFGDVDELQKQRAAIVARQGAQTTGLTTQQQYERMQWTAGLDLRGFEARFGGPTQAETRAREREEMRVRHEQEMGGPEGSPTRLKEGTDEYKKVHAAQIAESKALDAKYRLEDEDRERRHQVVMRDALAGAAFDREAIRKREMDRIRESYADDIKKFGETEEIKAEIKAKQDALAVQQGEQRRTERAGIIEQALRAPGVGGQFADEAARLELEEQQRKRRMEHPEMAALFDKEDAAESAEMAAQQNWKPSEVASRKGAWDAGRPSGYDRFMPGQTPEAKALGEYLQKNYGQMDQILKLLQGLAGNLGVAPAGGG